jgi:O-methyltransferase involved in polyketide biosynthesis
MSPSESISATAHYTGYVWARNGLSHPELATIEGRLLFESIRPVFAISGALGGASLEAYLLARHTAIDVLLERAIDGEHVSQVIEVTCGLSPRGWRFTERHPELTYVEADLPAMAERKRRALERMGSLSDRHRVATVDALTDVGPGSLASVAAGLDRARGFAIVTEGLLGYLDIDAVEGMLGRLTRVLAGFADGRYISDFHVREIRRSTQVRVFAYALAAFVRGRVHFHFEDSAQAEAALARAGFATAHTYRAIELGPHPHRPGGELVHILEASIR